MNKIKSILKIGNTAFSREGDFLDLESTATFLKHKFTYVLTEFILFDVEIHNFENGTVGIKLANIIGVIYEQN